MAALPPTALLSASPSSPPRLPGVPDESAIPTAHIEVRPEVAGLGGEQLPGVAGYAQWGSKAPGLATNRKVVN